MNAVLMYSGKSLKMFTAEKKGASEWASLLLHPPSSLNPE